MDNCSICLDELIEKYKLTCNHTFHKCCIESWFNKINNTLCPLCRRIVKPINGNGYKDGLGVFGGIFVSGPLMFPTVDRDTDTIIDDSITLSYERNTNESYSYCRDNITDDGNIFFKRRGLN